MKRRWANLPAYLQIAGLWPQMAYTYRVSLAFDVLRLLLKVYLLKVIWTAVYHGRSVVDGVELDHLIAFITLAQLQVWVMAPLIAGYIQGQVRSGQIALELARPVPFLGQLLAHQVGATVAWLPFVVLAVPLGFVLGGIVPPASPAAALLYLLSLVLAYLVAVLIGMIMGLWSFWTLQTGGILAIYEFANEFFTGALVPLAFFPALLRRVADLLPFQAQAFIPISIYMGQPLAWGVGGALALQVLWIGVLFIVAWVMWRRAMRRVVIQGG